jgi:two-component system, OmpR family, response regulator
MTEAGRVSNAQNLDALGQPSEFANYGGPRLTRVLVLDDDRSMQHVVGEYLRKHGMQTAVAVRPQDVARHFVVTEPDMVILGRRLGDHDGLDLMREIRVRSDVPVIIISGHQHDEADRVLGLELGADDYITKPFGLRELVARIRAVLRGRSVGRIVFQRELERGRCRFGNWLLDRRTRQLIGPRGTPRPLTKSEYALLIAFLAAPQRPLTREHLLRATRMHEDVFDRSIDVQILRLRRKLEADADGPQIIRTERGVGYSFALPVEQL